ncbi:MAG TPA: hypothetical protein ENF38_00055 [Candidatus Aenigmarchaeota archaeon]|nr:hypothetical protein [Candidatus Aenigmarchaeota archaeon]
MVEKTTTKLTDNLERPEFNEVHAKKYSTWKRVTCCLIISIYPVFCLFLLWKVICGVVFVNHLQADVQSQVQEGKTLFQVLQTHNYSSCADTGFKKTSIISKSAKCRGITLLFIMVLLTGVAYSRYRASPVKYLLIVAVSMYLAFLATIYVVNQPHASYTNITLNDVFKHEPQLICDMYRYYSSRTDN